MRRTGVMTASRATAIGLTLAAALAMSTAWTGAAQPPPPAGTQPPATPPAQPPAAAPAAPAQTASFTTDAGMMNFYVKSDKTAEFETLMNRYKEALLKSDNADFKQAASGMKLFKSTVPVQGNTVYIMVVNPVVKGMDYSANGIVKVWTAVYPTEAAALFTQLKEAYAGHQGLSIQPMMDFSK